MATPITLETSIGYIVTEDVYIAFTEYYGDGTIYGRSELSMPDGSPVKGEGKSKKDLLELGVLMSDVVAGALVGDLIWVHSETPVLLEAPVEVPVEVPVVPEAPVEVKPKTYMVVASILGFKVSREFNVKIDEETNTLYLE